MSNLDRSQEDAADHGRALALQSLAFPSGEAIPPYVCTAMQFMMFKFTSSLINPGKCWVYAKEMHSPVWVPAATAQGWHTHCLTSPSFSHGLSEEFSKCITALRKPLKLKGCIYHAWLLKSWAYSVCIRPHKSNWFAVKRANVLTQGLVFACLTLVSNTPPAVLL